MKDSILTEMEKAYREIAGEDNVRLLDEMEQKVQEIQQHQAVEEMWLIVTIIICLIGTLIPLFVVFGSCVRHRLSGEQERVPLSNILSALSVCLIGGIVLFLVNFSTLYARHEFNQRGQILVVVFLILLLSLGLWWYLKRKSNIKITENEEN